ncbi:MAG: tRNA preQ1(34) S-adenosylmethionine ribosyltransferase-isomerase QueA [Verrucomicrobiae bacterium]|nr:tRNA preQ1(34) S-adenosylmethionine ribosyltransferase-isomerase QueA [Verrucomicrobiae bacterium]
MRTADFDYDLPTELIAQYPPERRGESRMMVVHRDSGLIEHRWFREFPEFIQTGDRLVLNDTRVAPARFFSNDGRIELLKVDARSPTVWRCLVKPGKRMKLGRTVEIADATGTVIEILPESGERIIEFDRPIDEETHGHLALPPYIDRPEAAEDRDRYQTVFARETGAIAAPTAGLHFTDELLGALPHSFLTLHVGIGTFRPVSVEDVTAHHMHSERFSLNADTAAEINAAERIVAVGTTVVRVLEHCAKLDGGLPLSPRRGETDIFIYPPYEFRAVGALLTNFHLPKSTLLMLVSGLASRDLILEAYAKAVEERYRFFSYGDCMLIL